MTSEKLFRALNEISDDKIQSALEYTGKAHGYQKILKYSQIAAGVLLAVGISWIVAGRLLSSTYHVKKQPDGENEELKKWDDKNKAEQYATVLFQGRKYSFTGSKTKEEDIGEFLAKGEADGTDDAGETCVSLCKIYAIQDISEICAVAVEFDGVFYTYINYDYSPQTFDNLADDLDLTHTLEIHQIMYQAAPGTQQEIYTYSDQEAVISVLMQARDSSNIGEAYIAISEQTTEKFWILAGIGISVEKIGARQISINLDSLGYMTTNILGTVKAFYLGPQEVERIAGELKGKGTFESVYDPQKPTQEDSTISEDQEKQ